MLAFIRDAGGNCRGMLWYQGESDTGPTEHRQYSRRFRQMVGDLRRSLRQPRLPVITAQLTRIFHNQAARCLPILIHTPLPWGGQPLQDTANRFSGFDPVRKTAEAVRSRLATQITPLKWGVNESARSERTRTCEITGLNRCISEPHDRPVHEYWELMRETQRHLARTMPAVEIISTLDLALSDGIHNDSQANLTIGDEWPTPGSAQFTAGT